MIRILRKAKERFRRNTHDNEIETEPVAAYDAWADTYDAQPDNLILALDEKLFSGLMADLSIEGKTIVDVGCGTGRHWKNLLSSEPAALYGYDTSAGMLEKLRVKFRNAKTFLLKDNRLRELKNESCDIVISTLTLAHIENMEAAIQEWDRVLKNNGAIILTDYHPAILAKGGSRTFKHEGKTIAVKSYVHEIPVLQKLADSLGFETVAFRELAIDDSVKHYYEKQNALATFERYKGIPVIYGIHLRKKNAASKSATDR